MSIGQIVRIIESIVTVCCGAVIAVRPCKMRWQHNAVKIIFTILIALAVLFRVANTAYAKFAATEYTIVSIYLFVVLFIFYRINFWQLFTQNFIYWYTLRLFHYFITYVCCVADSMVFSEYIEEINHMPWHWLHIIDLISVIGIVLFIFFKMKEKELIKCRKKVSYFFLLFWVIIEELIDQYVFTRESGENIISSNYLILITLIFLLLISVVIILVITKSFLETRHQEQMSQMNLMLVKKQYDLLQEMYIEKRRQIHDAVQQDILLRGYLMNNENDKAIHYLNQKLSIRQQQQKNRYTGISVIDLMMDYKVTFAEHLGILVNLDLDVYNCFVDDTDMCILLGNLLDNAIEAVQNLPNQLKNIEVMMKTPNSIFLLEMKNAFEGKRKKVEDKYITTKKNKDMHGLGLESVRKIVEKYNGSMEINDDNQIFEVVVTLFKNLD